ncbi:hypothetical protein C8Q76DRAFT_706976 [Earliella scabrosa]|nr:hypothetical protein C8Q76DRAFT_706976 [Earliella scabrosa]
MVSSCTTYGEAEQDPMVTASTRSGSWQVCTVRHRWYPMSGSTYLPLASCHCRSPSHVSL